MGYISSVVMYPVALIMSSCCLHVITVIIVSGNLECVPCIVHLLVNKRSKWKVRIVKSLMQIFCSSATSCLLASGVTDGQSIAACNLKGIHMKRGVYETEHSCNKSFGMKQDP